MAKAKKYMFALYVVIALVVLYGLSKYSEGFGDVPVTQKEIQDMISKLEATLTTAGPFFRNTILTNIKVLKAKLSTAPA